MYQGWWWSQFFHSGIVLSSSANVETDKEVNVRLYQRHRYEVIGEEPVLGVKCWYMRRPA